MKSKQAFSLFLAALLPLVAPPWCASAEKSDDLDAELLGDLDKLDEDLLQETQPESKAQRSKSDDQGAKKQDALDEQLLRELDVDDDLGEIAGEDIPDGAESGAARVEELGEEADPLTRIGQKMRNAEGLLPEQSALGKTKKVQDEIVKDLAELIKELQKRQQQQQASSQQKRNSQQQASRSRINLPRNQQARKKPGTQESKKPAMDSEDRLGKPKKPEIDPAELNELIKEIWGHLPEKERERLRQKSADEIMPSYELLIEKYFRRLAEDDENLP